MAAAAPTSWEDDDWEIYNDNGFVYKRRRRNEAELAGPPPPASDPEADLRRNRRARRRICLRNLRDKYRDELQQWEGLAATLGQLTDPPPTNSPSLSSSHSLPPSSSRQGQALPPVLGPDRGQLIEGLLLQVEAHEAVLHKVTELCDYVEAECKAREDRMVQSLVDLPVWGSPRALMAFLSDQSES